MTKQIIVADEKHGTYYYDADTPEAWAKSALKILTERFNQGYWYHDPIGKPDKHPFSVEERTKREELLAMTDEQIDAIPSDEARVVLRKKRQQAQKRHREDERQSEEYQRIREVVEAQDDGMIVIGKGKRYEREEPKAWRLLDDRNDHEYERVSLEDVWDGDDD